MHHDIDSTGGADRARGATPFGNPIYIYRCTGFFGDLELLGLPPDIIVFTINVMARLKWNKIRDDFFSSDLNLRELASKHGGSANYLNQIAAKEKWYKQREELQAGARRRVTEQIADELVKGSDKSLAMEPLDVQEHLKRSVRTGDQLYLLFESAVTAMKQGDLRTMRQAISAWVELDNQMRKVHGVEGSGEKPLVNINVMAQLPKPSEIEGVDVESSSSPEPQEIELPEPTEPT